MLLKNALDFLLLKMHLTCINGVAFVMKNTLSLLVFCVLWCGSALAQPTANVNVDTNLHHQMITGWEGAAYIGQDHPNFAEFAPRLPELFDSIVHQLGINRVKVEIRSGSENPRNYWEEYQEGTIDSSTWSCVRYSTINDNDDPRSINLSGFHFAEIDSTIKLIVLPLKQRLEAKGEKLFLNVNYVAFTDEMRQSQCSDTLQYFHAVASDEYAEFVLATYLHLRDTWGIVPDAWEVILQPDHTTDWHMVRTGRAIIAAAERLQENGFTPRFIAPSGSSPVISLSYFDKMIEEPGLLDHLEEISYHGHTDFAEDSIRERMKQYGVKSSMLKYPGADYTKLHEDLSTTLVSSWSQFNLAAPYYGIDDGNSYYLIDFADTVLNFGLGSRTTAFMQYFRYIRKGDQRVEATSSHPNVKPLAFVSPDGFRKYVLKIDAPATVNLNNLPGGRYTVSFTVPGEMGEHIDPVDQEPNTTMTAFVPGAVVMTVVQQTKIVASVERESIIAPIRIVNSSPLILSVTASRSDVLEVFDILGKKIFSTDVTAGTSTIFLPSLAKGAYTVRLTGNPTSTIKIAQ